MPVTVRLPDELHGAEFRSASLNVGEPIVEGAPLASFSLDDESVILHSSASGVLLQVLLSEPLECRTGDPIALVGSAGESVGYEPDRIECARLQLLNECTECGNAYPINGLVKRARCTRCGDLQAVPSSFWKEDVAEALEFARVPGARGGGVTLGGPSIECRGLPPLCRKCFTLIDMDALSKVWHEASDETRAQLHCGQCGEPHSARRPPEWAKELIEDSVFVFGEVTGEPGPEGPKPVIFKCPSCLASLEIIGEKRIVRCKYCESDVYLPDDLWLHFNPAAKRAFWWILFSPKKR
jgi:predicted RNA-binding Zn-ribbon protein involved in translation (DUF1610 family)